MDMSKTLSENGIPDEDGELDQCRMDRDLYAPSICLYFNDDLTEIWPKGRTVIVYNTNADIATLLISY